MKFKNLILKLYFQDYNIVKMCDIEELTGIPSSRNVVVSGENGLYTPCLRDVFNFYSTIGNSYRVKVCGNDDVIPNYHIDFVYQVPTGTRYDKRFYNVRCFVKSVLDPECTKRLTDKKLLYELVKEYNPGNIGFSIPSTYSYSNFNFEDKVYIIKATGKHTLCGKGNAVFSNPNEFNIAKDKLEKNGYDLRSSIISRYIDNPILFEGRKTHFRSFIMLSTHSSQISVFDRIVVRLAKERYVKGLWENDAIHDTHTSSSGVDIYLPLRKKENYDYVPNCKPKYKNYGVFEEGDVMKRPERYECLQKYYDGVMKATKAIANMIKLTTKAKSPAESQHAFEVFAVDLLVTESRVFLLEINSKVSYKSALTYIDSTIPSSSSSERTPNDDSLDHVIFSHAYFSWIYRNGYAPFEKERNFAITGGTGLILSFLEANLSAFGWSRVKEHEMNTSVNYIFFNYLEKMSNDLRRFAPSASRIKCFYKNILTPCKMCIADKGLLFKNMPDKSFMARSWLPLDEIPQEVQDSILILRPIGDYADSGFGIRITQSSSELQSAITEIKNSITNSEGKLSSFIVSEYSQNPLLYHGKKYHLRSFFIFRKVKGTKEGCRWDIFDRSRIVTAKLPYVNGDWTNPLIHDTHSKTTDCNIFVDTPDLSYLSNLLAKIMIDHNVEAYEESEIGYEVFGLDILPTTSGYVLLEVNSRVGMKDLGDREGCPYEDTFAKFSDDYFNWMLRLAL